MNRPAVVIEPRRPLARREVIELAVRQSGRCACPCGEKLNALTEGVTDEHRIALALGGTNDLANRELWRTPCAKAKTAKKDQPAIAKCNRIIARENGTRRERKAIPSRPNAWPKGRKLPTKASRNAGDKLARYDDGAAGGMNPNEGADQ
jgi:hypothetical protein